MARSAKFSLSAAVLAAMLAADAAAADLAVSVIGLRNANGEVHIAVYDRPETYPESEGMLTEVKVPIAGNRAHYIFKDLKPAFYAIAVYHDENSNRDFDTGFMGMPLEGYGFSNDARVFLGPPSFDEAKFALPKDGTVTVIKMTY